MLIRASIVYGLLLAVWGTVVGWQTVEHERVKNAARRALLNRPQATGKTLVKVIQSLGFDVRSSGRLVAQDRLERVLKGLVTDGEVKAVALLNAAGEPVVWAGETNLIESIRKMQTGQQWDAKTVTLVRRVDLSEMETPEGETNKPSILVPSMSPRREAPGPPRDRTRPADQDSQSSTSAHSTDPQRNENKESSKVASSDPPEINHPVNAPSSSLATNQNDRSVSAKPGEGRPPRKRPLWYLLNEEERKSMAEKRGLHGLVIAMSTDSFRTACVQDLWLRWIIGAFAGVSAAGLAFAWRNVEKSSELQMRLVRASELNSHLREMNLAAAGLAHETRNPLNIIRGLAHMISKESQASEEIRRRSREITDEVDRVTGQLNEFINYSRPREIRRAPLSLNTVAADVVRALQSDIEDKAIKLSFQEENLTIEADEQLLRQVLFNLLLNAIQAVDRNGEIQIVSKKSGPTEALLEVRDNGPGVPPEQREEIFKPYFTTNQKGTGLGLAVVQQIILAHGWEIECLANNDRGAVFRVSRMQLTSKT